MAKVINNDVEKIVNNQERQENIKKFHNKQKIKKRRKMIVNSCACMVFAVIFALFSFFKLMVSQIGLPISLMCILCESFFIGRWYENGKCLGWK